MGDHVRIYEDSALPLKQAVAEVRNLPDEDAAAWKQSFVIALERMARRQPSLAHLTALEILNAFRFSFNNSELVAELRRIERRPLRGATSPRAGLHPLDLVRRYREALECFQPGIVWEDILSLSPGRARKSLKTGLGITWKDVQNLRRKWGPGALPTKIRVHGNKDDKVPLRDTLEAEPNAHERSLVLLAAAHNTTKAVVRNALSRAGVLRGLGLRPIPISYRGRRHR